MTDKLYLEHTLLQATGDTKDVQMSVLKFADYEKAFIAHSDNQEKLTEYVIMHTTGLSQAQLDDLTVPDFTTLENASVEQVNRSSEFYFDKAGKEFGVAKPALFDPLDDVENITYTIPKMKAYKMMQSIENTNKAPFAQSRYITAVCTGLDQLQINELSVRDWNMLQGRITDFLEQEAGYLAKSQ